MAFHNSGRIVTSGLVLSLDAADRNSYLGSGTTWTDLTGRSNNATLLNGPTYTTSNGGAIVFDGVNDYATVSNDPSLNSTSGTVSIWYSYATVINLYASLIGKHDSNGSRNGWNIYVLPDGSGGAQIKDSGTGSINANVIPAYSASLWRNISLTYTSGVSCSLYANAVLYFTGSCIPFSIFTGSLQMVDSVDSFWGIMSGSIASVQIYNRELSAQEVKQNYDAMKSRFNLT